MENFFYLGVEIADVIRTCLPIGTCSIFTARFLSPSFAVTFSTLLIPLFRLFAYFLKYPNPYRLNIPIKHPTALQINGSINDLAPATEALCVLATLFSNKACQGQVQHTLGRLIA